MTRSSASFALLAVLIIIEITQNSLFFLAGIKLYCEQTNVAVSNKPIHF